MLSDFDRWLTTEPDYDYAAEEDAYIANQEYGDIKEAASRIIMEFCAERGVVDAAVILSAWQAAIEEYLSKVH